MVSDLGYAVESVMVNAAEYGVPQVRKRIFYYGWQESRVPRFRFPAATHSDAEFRTVWDAIGNLPPPRDTREAETGGDPLHWRMKLSALNVERLHLIPPGGGFESLPVNMRVNCHKRGAAKIGHRYVYGRLAPDRPSSTITARFDSFTRGKFGHPHEDRNLTLREGARLQTFPDDFVFTGTQEDIAALIGNAIPPLLAAAIGFAIFKHLGGGLGDNVQVRDIERAQYDLFDAHAK
jgi:DNA (cytosine-5)-methyltransferase 1